MKQTSKAAAMDLGPESPPMTPWSRFGNKAWEQHGVSARCSGRLHVDIKSYFDTLDHTHLRQMLDKRIRDGVIRRLIDKWLKAGVMEQGKLSYQDEGTPQGGVISPLLRTSTCMKCSTNGSRAKCSPG